MSTSCVAGSTPAVSMPNVHDAGPPKQSGQAHFSGQIKNPHLMTTLRFRAGLMSAKGERAYNLARLERNGLKLERDVLHLIKATNASIGRASQHKTFSAIGDEIGKVSRRMEKILAFNDVTRTDGMPKAVVEKAGTKGIIAETVVYRAIDRSLDACGDLTKQRVLDYMAGAAGDTDPDVIRDRTDSLIAYSNRRSPGIARKVVEAFKWAREDQALRESLTAAPLDAEKLSIFGQRIRAERNSAQPLSEKLSGKFEACALDPHSLASQLDPASPHLPSRDYIASLPDVPSLNGRIEGGTLRRPQPPARIGNVCETERSLARVVEQLSSGQRAQLSAVLPRYEGEVHALRQNKEFEKAVSLQEAVDTILRVLNERASSAEKAFGRYEKAQYDTDFKHLSAIFARSIPHIKKTWGHELFSSRNAVDRELQDAIEKVVAGCRKACGSHTQELKTDRLGIPDAMQAEPQRPASRDAYYEKLAGELAAKFQARLPHRPYRPDYVVEKEILERLKHEDEAQAGIPRPPIKNRLGTPAALDQGDVVADSAVAARVDDRAAQAEAIMVADWRVHLEQTHAVADDEANVDSGVDSDAENGDYPAEDDFSPPPSRVLHQDAAGTGIKA